MNCNSGFFTGRNYDKCAHDKDVYESISPYLYQMYDGKYENCKRCVVDKLYKRGDVSIVDMESELLNITRKSSKCPQKQYSPKCKKSKNCVSTFDNSVPVVLAAEVCPIIKTNMNKPEYYRSTYNIRPISQFNCKGVPVDKYLDSFYTNN